eukprot:SM000056S17978  [mRNA]  locus=s56:410042:419662:+ [translate_table: standard]
MVQLSAAISAHFHFTAFSHTLGRRGDRLWPLHVRGLSHRPAEAKHGLRAHDAAHESEEERVAIVGGGAGGVELCLAMQHRLVEELKEKFFWQLLSGGSIPILFHEAVLNVEFRQVFLNLELAAELLHREFKIKKDLSKHNIKDGFMEKYGNAAPVEGSIPILLREEVKAVDEERNPASSWGTGTSDDVVLDMKKLKEALKKVSMRQQVTVVTTTMKEREESIMYLPLDNSTSAIVLHDIFRLAQEKLWWQLLSGGSIPILVHAVLDVVFQRLFLEFEVAVYILPLLKGFPSVDVELPSFIFAVLAFLLFTYKSEVILRDLATQAVAWWTHRSLGVEVPGCRGHILWDMRIDLFSIFVELRRSEAGLPGLFEFDLLAMVLSRLE